MKRGKDYYLVNNINKKKLQNPSTPHGGSVDQIFKKASLLSEQSLGQITKSSLFSPVFFTSMPLTEECISTPTGFKNSQMFSRTIPILLACAAKVHGVYSSPRFPPANQVLRSCSLTGIETLGPWRLGALGCG